MDIVPTGADALLLLEQVAYDVVFIDLMLTATSGQDVLAWIEEHRPSLLERCIVLSSAAPVQLERVRERWPGVRTIRKPFELSEIVEIAQTTAAMTARRRGSPAEEFTRRSIAAGAKAGVAMRTSSDGLVPVMWFGYTLATLQAYSPIALNATVPLAEAANHQRPVWLASVAAAAGDYPHLLPIWKKFDSRAVAAIPVMRDGEVVGAVGWTFREARLFHEPEQQTFLSIGGLLAEFLKHDSSPTGGLSA